MVGGDLILSGNIAVKLVAGDDLVLFGLARFEIGRLTVLAYDRDFAEVLEGSLVVTVFFGEVDGAVEAAVLGYVSKLVWTTFTGRTYTSPL